MATWDIGRLVPQGDGEAPVIATVGTFTEGPNDQVPSLTGFLVARGAETGDEHVAALAETQDPDAPIGWVPVAPAKTITGK